MNKLAKLFLSAALTVAMLLTVTGTALAMTGCDGTATCCTLPKDGVVVCTCCCCPSSDMSMRQEYVADPSPIELWEKYSNPEVVMKSLMDPKTKTIAPDSIPKDVPRILLFNSNEFEVRAGGSVIMLIPRVLTPQMKSLDVVK